MIYDNYEVIEFCTEVFKKYDTQKSLVVDMVYYEYNSRLEKYRHGKKLQK